MNSKSKVLKFSEAVEVKKTKLSYCAFDWDDNILHMSTLIHMDRLVGDKWIPQDVSTSEFAIVRKDSDWRIRDNDATKAFCEFRDSGPRGQMAFVDDTISAIDNNDFGPSWKAFINYLSKGTVFAIITARGHEPETIKKAVEYIIDNVLSEDQKHSLYAHCLKFAYLFGKDYDLYDRIPKGALSKTKLISDYLDTCEYYGVSSKYCIDKFGLGDTSNPELGKEMAMKEFTKKAHTFGEKIGAKVSMGFSDDDVKNVDHIEKIFKNELCLKYLMNYVIYDTSDRTISGGVKKKIFVHENQSSIGNGMSTWGTDSSVIPFTKWNNMTQNLSPKDNPADPYQNQFRNKIGQIKDLTDIKVKKKG